MPFITLQSTANYVPLIQENTSPAVSVINKLSGKFSQDDGCFCSIEVSCSNNNDKDVQAYLYRTFYFIICLGKIPGI